MGTTSERFTLEKYRTPASRHTCPECGKRREFTRYIDTWGAIQFPENVGKCNREMNCGYHFPPKEYFKKVGISFDRDGNVVNPLSEYSGHRQTATANHVRPVAAPRVASYIPSDIQKRSLTQKDNLSKFLFNQLPAESVLDALRRYQVGTSKHWDGATVFWQIDGFGKVRSGKVMLYDSATGRRDKREEYKPTWAHKILRLGDDFNLMQCFFGEHLLAESTGRVVAVVESEKTAIIASVYFAHLGYTWLAIGGKNFPALERWEPLRDRKILLFPDTGLPKGTVTKTPFEQWQEKAEDLRKAGFRVTVSELLERRASVEERESGADLADFLLRFSPKDFQPAEIAKPQAADNWQAFTPQQGTPFEQKMGEDYPAILDDPRPVDEAIAANIRQKTVVHIPERECSTPPATTAPDMRGFTQHQRAALTKAIATNSLVTDLIGRFELRLESVNPLNN